MKDASMCRGSDSPVNSMVAFRSLRTRGKPGTAYAK
jgi:hypothetical protein